MPLMQKHRTQGKPGNKYFFLTVAIVIILIAAVIFLPRAGTAASIPVLLLAAVFFIFTVRLRERLYLSEQRYRQLFEENSDAIFVADPLTRKLIDCNKKAQTLTGFTKEEILSMRADQLHPPEVAAETMEAFKRQASGQLNSVDSQVLTKDGKRLHVSINTMVFHVEGKPCLLGVFRDISERKCAENALKASEEKLPSLFEYSQDGIILIHPQQGVFDCNTAALKMFGLTSKDELKGKHIGVAFSPDLQPGGIPSHILRQKYLEEAYRKGFITFNWVYKRQDGSTFTAEVILNLVAYGAESVLQAVLRDITKRQQAEEELRKSEAQLSNAVKIAHLGPWELDIQKNVFTFNDAFYALFRTTAKEVGGYTMSPSEYVRRFFYPEDAELVRIETQKAIETNDPNFSRQLEHRIRYADGTPGYIAVRYFIVKDENGRTIKTYGVNQDITERKQAEEEIKRKIQELERFNKISVDRELKMIELKKKIEELEAQLKEKEAGGFS